VVDEFSTEEEQVEAIKRWWKENGTSLIIGVVLGLSALFGWRYWTSYNETQMAAASNAYVRMNGMIEQKNMEGAAAQNQAIRTEYPESSYASMASLTLAKYAVEENSLEQAAELLGWALDNSTLTGMEHISRLRLAQILLQQNKPQEAVNLLAVTEMGAFQARYEELRGDAYVKLGDNQKASQAYQISLLMLSPGSRARVLLEMKANDLGNISQADVKPDETELAEPKQSESEQAEPKQAESEQTEPKQPEPKQAEPDQTESEQSEPKQSEPKQAEPDQS